MQSGIDSSRLRLASAASSAESGITKVDIHPDPKPSSGFFGADGLSFRDVLDAVNPLNHIPIVSDLLADATGHTVSTASKLVGGTLLGGPIGFVASLATVIFQQESGGKSPVMAAYAALTGDSTTAVAAAVPPAEPAVQLAEAAVVTPVETQQLAALAVPTPISASDSAVLDLYGASPASAHSSYKKVQLLPYLRDVNTSQVL
ncbi:MAG: hypothetical protein V4735_03795 [Pseudomonadota bacterium]